MGKKNKKFLVFFTIALSLVLFIKNQPKLFSTVNNKRRQEINSQKIENFLDNRDNDIPLSGGLRYPQPMIKMGHIEKGADILFGIPTVKREGISYLQETLSSLFDNLKKDRKINVKFIVFVAETDKEYLNKTISQISEQFPEQIKNNILQIISPSPNLYPGNWSTVISMPDHFGDSYDRVKWRSKENLDMVHLLMYGHNLQPDYYVMMEDDVITQSGYVEDIMEFVKENESKDYFYLSFCLAGSIGKLFRRNTLPKFATFVHMYYNKKPLDWLQYDFSTLDLCAYSEPCDKCRERMKERIIHRKPSLFQHSGKISSLKGKEQNFKDETFGKKDNELNFINILAELQNIMRNKKL